MSKFRCFDTYNLTSATSSDNTKRLKRQTIFTETQTLAIGNSSYQTGKSYGTISPGYKKKNDGSIYYGPVYVNAQDENKNNGCLIGAKNYDLLYDVLFGGQQATILETVDETTLALAGSAWEGNAMGIKFQSVGDVGPAIMNTPDGCANYMSYPSRQDFLPVHYDACGNPPMDFPGIIIDPCYNIFYPRCVGKSNNNNYLKNIKYTFTDFQITNPEFIDYLSHTSSQAFRQFPYVLNYDSTSCNIYRSEFIFTFYNLTGETNLAKYLPISNKNGSFQFGTILYVSDPLDDKIITITVPFKFIYTGSPTDGLTFYSITNTLIDFYNATGQPVIINQFGGIPLARDGKQFKNLTGIAFSTVPGDDPTILPSTSLESTFENTNFDYDVSTWDTTSVTNMSAMFKNTPFNGPLNTWNTTNVTDFSSMFENDIYFNQQISYDPVNDYWNTSNVLSMDSMFQNAVEFNNGYAGKLSPTPDIDHPLNWLLNNNVTLLYVRTNANNLTNQNAYPLSANYIFAYTFYNTIGATDADICNNLPLYITDSEYTFGKTIDGSLIDVTVIFNTVNGYRPDGITFYDPSGSKVAFYNSTNAPVHLYFLNATPLARKYGGYHFANLNHLDLSSISPPEIFPDTSLNYSFYNTNILPNSNLNEWPVHEVISMVSTFEDSSFSQDLTKWNTGKVKDMSSMFKNATFNGHINTWNTTNVTTMASMFQNNQTFNTNVSYDVSNNYWNTEHVTDMTNIFNNSTSFNNGYDPSDILHPLNWSLDISINKTDAVTDASSLTYENGQPLTSANVGKFVYHFYNINETSYEDICANYLPFQTTDNCLRVNPPVITTSIDTSGLTMTTVTVYFGFTDNGTTNDGLKFTPAISDYYNSTAKPFIITSFQEIPLSRSGSQFYNLNYLQIHTDMPAILTNTSLENCFYNCFTYDSYIGNWDVTNAINMRGMFSGCHAFNQDISLWNTSNITDMSGIFYDCTSFDQDINAWDVANVTNMSYMFYGCISFSGYLNNWNTSNVTNMSYMFYGCEYFNQDINSFNTSSVTDMSHMLEGCYAFDRAVSSWDMFNVTNMNSMFKGCANFNRNVSFDPTTGAWITCNVMDMTSVFEGCIAFNNGYPIDDIDHPLNWHLEGATVITNSTTNTPVLTIQNAYPLSAAYRGKFVYSFYNTAGTTDASIAEYLPFVTTDDNLKYNPISIATDPSDATLKTVYVFYGFRATASPTTNDGLYFYDYSINNYYNATNQPITILEFQNMPLSRQGSQFRDLSGIVISAIDNPTLLPNTSLANCFNNCVNFNSAELIHWNLKNATSMNSMFANASTFNQSLTYNNAYPDQWDTSAVTDMTAIFEGATSFNNGYPTGNMDSCLNWILNPAGVYTDPLISSNLTFETAFPLSNCPSGTFIFKFYNDASYTNTDIINNIPFKKTSGRITITETPTISYVVDSSGRLTTVSVPYKYVDTNNISPSVNSDGLYLYDNSFAQLVSTKEFFITRFDKIPLSRAGSQLSNVKKLVIDASAGIPGLTYVPLNATFGSSTYFNSYIGNWDTRYVYSMNSTFNNLTLFNNGNTSNSGTRPLLWNTSRVTNMQAMFYNAAAFNQCISHSAASTARIDFSPLQIGTFSYSIYTPYFGGTDANPNLSWFDGRTPVSTGTTSNLSSLETAINNYGSYLNMSVKWTSNYTATATGTYTFYLDSDDGAFFTVDGNIIIYNGGEHGTQRRTGTIYMTTGQTYIFNIYFGNNGGPYGFSFGGSATVLSSDSNNYWNTSKVTNMENMFRFAAKFNNGDPTNAGLRPLKIHTNSVTSLQYMFYCYTGGGGAFNQNISHDPSGDYWNTSNVMYMNWFLARNIFNNGDPTNAGTKPLKLYTNSALNMSAMFQENGSFNQTIESDASGYWNTSNVQTFRQLFYGSSSFNNGDPTNAGTKPFRLFTNSATDLRAMLYGTPFNQYISHDPSNGYWNTSNVTNMTIVFYGCSRYNNGDITNAGTKPLNLYTNNATDFSSMFELAQSFNQKIGHDPSNGYWNTSNVQKFVAMFKQAYKFNNGDITDAGSKPLNFNTSACWDVQSMFWNASVFNQTICHDPSNNYWNTSGVQSMTFWFNQATKFNNGDISNAGSKPLKLYTNSCKNMYITFQDAPTFNQTIGHDASGYWNTSSVTTFQSMFNRAPSFNNGDISNACSKPLNFYTNIATRTDGMFGGNSSFNQTIGHDPSNGYWNTSNVTLMFNMFNGATIFNNGDISNAGTKPLNLNTNSATNMVSLFEYASNFNQTIGHDPSNGYWNTSNVTLIYLIFHAATLFNNGDISNAGTKPLKLYTNAVTNLAGFFWQCPAFNQTIGHDASNYWNTSNVTEFNSMFDGNTLFNNGDISNAGTKPLKLYTNKSINCYSMFQYAYNFNQAIGHDSSNGYWNMSTCTTMLYMFAGAYLFNNGDISNAGTKPLNLYTNAVTNMDTMFGDAHSFNQTIGHNGTTNYWNTSNVTNMFRLFRGALSYNNGDISNACTKPLKLYTTAATNLGGIFENTANFNQTVGHDASNYWNTSNATGMNAMFNLSPLFNNGDISNAGTKPLNLYTNKATTLEALFGEASSFNQTIGYSQNASGYWNTTLCTNMHAMFYNASLFNNGDISNAGTKSLGLYTNAATNMNAMFAYATNFNQNVSYNSAVPNIWNTTLVTDMSSIFYNASIFNNGYPAGNADHCLNWVLSSTGNYSYAIDGANTLTFNNGYPLTNTRSGTFIFKFYNTPNYSTTDISKNLPIKKTNGRMSTSAPTITSTTDSSGTLVTVSVPYKFVETQVPAANDGLYLYDNSLAQLTNTKEFFITQFDGIQLSRVGQQFRNVKRLIIDPSAGYPGLTYCSLSGGFMDATNFNSYIGDWNTSTVTAMTSIFQNATSFNNSDPSNAGTKSLLWNTSKVTSMNNMFQNATAYNQYMSHDPSNNYWNTSIVINMSSMFNGTSIFNNGDISNAGTKPLKLYTNKATNLQFMLLNSTNFNQTIGHDASGYWDTSAATTFQGMFYSTIFNNGDISNACTKPLKLYSHNVTTLDSMFSGSSNFNQTIGHDASNYWNTANVTNMFCMFNAASTYNNGDISNAGTKPLKLYTNKVTNLQYVFGAASSFNQYISHDPSNGYWDTSSCTDMTGMFGAVLFNNGDISNAGTKPLNLYTNNVTTVYTMFNDASSFNQTIGHDASNYWNTSKVTTFYRMFNNAYLFNNGDISDAGTKPLNFYTNKATDMGIMFSSAKNFNQTIGYNASGYWDTSSVTQMDYLFHVARAFNNGDPSGQFGNKPLILDTRRTKTMYWMFRGARSFNQNVSYTSAVPNSWNTSAVTDMRSIFYHASNFNNGYALGNADHCLNWVLSSSGNYVDATTYTWSLTYTNGYPLTSYRSGTFAFQMYNIPNYSTTDISKNLPIKKTNARLTTFAPTITVLNPTTKLTSVSIPYKFIDNASGSAVDGLYFYDSSYRSLSVSNELMITQFDNIPLYRLGSGQFRSMPKLTFAPGSGKPTLFRTSLTSTFQDSSMFNSYIGDWNTQYVTDLSGTFYNAISFNNGDTSNACTKPLLWNTDNVTTCFNLFNNAQAYNQYMSHDPSNGYWNTSKVTSMNGMFYTASLFNNGDISNAGTKPLKLYTNKVTNLSEFCLDANQFNQTIGHDPSNGYWDTSNAINMISMFNGASIYNNGDISNAGTKPLKLYTTAATTMESMFKNASNFNQTIGHDASNYWNTSKVTTFYNFFNNVNTFNNGDISNACTKPLNLYTNKATNMSYMFSSSENFNQTIGYNASGYWDTSSVTTMQSFMYFSTRFNNGDPTGQPGTKPLILDTQRTTNMSQMFRRAYGFNQNISYNPAIPNAWNTSLVTNMDSVLYSTYSFNNGYPAGNMDNCLNWILSISGSYSDATTSDGASILTLTNGFPLISTRTGTFIFKFYNTPNYTTTDISKNLPIKKTDGRMITYAPTITSATNPSGTLMTVSVPYKFVDTPIPTPNDGLYLYDNSLAKFTNTKEFFITQFDGIPLSRLGLQFRNVTRLIIEPTAGTPGLAAGNLQQTFWDALNFNSYVGDWNTSAVTNMVGTFLSANSFNNGEASTSSTKPLLWNTSKVTSGMNSMFQNASVYNQYMSHDPINNYWNTSNVMWMNNMFNGASNFNNGDTTNAGTKPFKLYTNKVPEMNSMFESASKFNQTIGHDASGYWDTSVIINMNSMFYNSTLFNNGNTTNAGTKPLNFNTNNCTDLSSIFQNASNFNQTIGHDPSNGYWNTSNVIHMYRMFRNASLYNNGDISNAGTKPLKFYTNALLTGDGMFEYCTNFNQMIGHDASNYWNTSNALRINGMFNGASSYNNGDITNACTKPLKLYTTKVTTLADTFANTGAFNQTVGHDASNYWNTSLCTTMYNMFTYASIFNNGDISNAGTKSLKLHTNVVTTMGQMFENASNFNQTIGHDPSNGYWNTSNVTTTFRMFRNAPLYNNGDISNACTKPLKFYTNALTSVDGMFEYCTNFNQTIGHDASNYWNTSNVTGINGMFNWASSYNNGDISNAGTKPLKLYTTKVTSYVATFASTGAFNQTVGHDASGYWDTSLCTNMYYMFFGASTFNNGDISNAGSKPLKLYTSKVTTMESMFQSASNFNQKISYSASPKYWDTSAVTNMTFILQDASTFNNGYPAGNADNCLNWILNLNGDYTNATNGTTNLTLTNGFPLISTRTGTFIFKFYNTPGYTNTYISQNLPIKTTNGRMATYTPTITSTTNPSGTLVTVSVPYKFVDTPIPAPNDGLYLYDNSLAQQTNTKEFFITQFDGIQLSRAGFQFANVQRLIIEPTAGTPGLAAGNLQQAFWDAINFNSYIGNWNTSAVTNMQSMFTSANSFNNGEPSTSSTKPLLWNTSKVTSTMNSMFHNAFAYNQYMSHDPSNNYWNTSNVTGMSNMFTAASNFNNGDTTNAGTKPLKLYTNKVTAMNSMFQYASNFNQTIGHDASGYWDTSLNTNIANLFFNATKFNNGDITNIGSKPLKLYTSKITTAMALAFSTVTNFNQNISYDPSAQYWNTSSATGYTRVIEFAPIFNNGYPAGNIDNPLNWILNRNVEFTGAGLESTGVTTENAFPLSSAKSGTFIFKFYNTPNYTNTDISKNLPIKTIDGRMRLSAPTITSTTDPSGTLVSVSVPYNFLDTQSGTPNDGLYLYDNSLAKFTNTKEFFITQFGGMPLSRLGSQFRNVGRLIIDPSAGAPTLLFSSLSYSFSDASLFNSYIGDWNTKSVRSMDGTFYKAYNFNNSDPSNAGTKPLLWNTHWSSTFASTFQYASSYNQYTSHNPSTGYWDTGKGTTMANMFSSANLFNNGDISNAGTKPLKLYTNKLTYSPYMFQNALSFNQYISHDPSNGYWDTSGATDIGALFDGATLFNNGDISNAGTKPLKLYMNSNVSLYGMFKNASNFNQTIGHDLSGYWNTSNTTNMVVMFYGNGIYNNGDISNAGTKPLRLYTNKVSALSDMFNGSSAFNQTIGSSGGYWDTSSVTSMENLFNNAVTFNNGDIGNVGTNPLRLYTNKVTTMNYMFNNAQSFNQTIESSGGYWDTSSVTIMANMFRYTGSFNNGDITNSGTKPFRIYTDRVTDMGEMFRNNYAFNQYISHDPSGGYWNTSKLQNTNLMFYTAIPFNNGDITSNGLKPLKWFTNSLTSMAYMFTGPGGIGMAFNQNISYDPSYGYWDVSNVASFRGLFTTYAPKFNNGYPANNETTPLNWKLNVNADYTTVLPNSTTTVNGFPLTNVRSGTFIFKFYNDPSYSNTDISNNLPIKRTDGRLLLTAAPTISSAFDSSGLLTTVSVPYKFIDNQYGTTTDGVYFYDHSFSKASSKPLTIVQFAGIPLSRSGSQFRGMRNFNIDPSDGIPGLTFVPLNSTFRDTSTNTYLGTWNTKYVTSMNSTFYNTFLFNNSDTSNAGTKPLLWNTDRVTDMQYMFYNTKAFNQTMSHNPAGPYFNTNKVTNMSYMFQNSLIFNNGDITNAGTKPLKLYTNAATTLTNMFYNAPVFNQTVGYDASGYWDTSSTSLFDSMFARTTIFNNGNTTNAGTMPLLLKTNAATNMDNMFYNCTAFNQYISHDPSNNYWNTSNLTTMTQMFKNTNIFNNSNLTDAGTKPLKLYTNNVTNMGALFGDATLFNQTIGHDASGYWNTSNVNNMSSMFTNSLLYNNGDITGSGTKPLKLYTNKVTSIDNMFSSAITFNQTISYDASAGYWDTSASTTFNSMFNGATNFNNGQTISSNIGTIPLNFKTSKATTLYSMFYNATGFNQKVSYDALNALWDTSSVTTMENVFRNAAIFNNSEDTGGTTSQLNWLLAPGVNTTNATTGSNLSSTNKIPLP